jgi:hypothetical protein
VTPCTRSFRYFQQSKVSKILHNFGEQEKVMVGLREIGGSECGFREQKKIEEEKRNTKRNTF